MAAHRHTPRFVLLQRRAGKLSVGPILLGFFFIVIVGSCARALSSNASGSWLDASTSLLTHLAFLPLQFCLPCAALLQIIRQASSGADR